MGMPSVIISFSQKAATALSRRERGIIAMILKDENVPEENPFVCLSSGDIPEGLSETNSPLLEKSYTFVVKYSDYPTSTIQSVHFI